MRMFHSGFKCCYYEVFFFFFFKRTTFVILKKAICDNLIFIFEKKEWLIKKIINFEFYIGLFIWKKILKWTKLNNLEICVIILKLKYFQNIMFWLSCQWWHIMSFLWNYRWLLKTTQRNLLLLFARLFSFIFLDTQNLKQDFLVSW